MHVTITSNAVGGAGAGGAAGSGTTGTPGPVGFSPIAGGISGTTQLSAAIVAGNAPQQCTRSSATGSYNLSYPDGTCPGVTSDPLLGPLADNAGPTATQAPLGGSPMLDAIPAGDPLCAGSDQRGVAIPAGAPCDIGAFQTVPPAATIGGTTVSQTGADATGVVTLNATSASVRVEYGESAAYGSATAEQAAGGGVTPRAVGASIGGLKPGTMYHYRVVATNLYGSSASADATFTTAVSGFSKAPLPLGGARFAGLSLARQKARLTARGAAPIRVACPAGTQGRCAGTLTLTTNVK